MRAAHSHRTLSKFPRPPRKQRERLRGTSTAQLGHTSLGERANRALFPLPPPHHPWSPHLPNRPGFVTPPPASPNLLRVESSPPHSPLCTAYNLILPPEVVVCSEKPFQGSGQASCRWPCILCSGLHLPHPPQELG